MCRRLFVTLTISLLTASILQLSIHEAILADVVLNFDTLPSNQGFIYQATGNGSGFGETQVFSVDGQKLTMNTMGLPLGSAGGNYYRMDGAVTPDAPFVLEWRSRVLEDEGSAAFGHFGFFASVDSSHSVVVAMSTQKLVVQTAGGNRITIDHDNTFFRDFKVVAIPGLGWDLIVDGSIVHQGLSFGNSSLSRLSFGDGTGFQNTRTEMNYYRFSHTAIPEPGAFSALSIALLLRSLQRRREARLR
jgi:hypothetical protein